MSGFALREGWWWPEADRDAHPIILADLRPNLADFLPHVDGRELIVQAGANVGVYPLALAMHFRRVVTCEPDPDNWACFQRNLEPRLVVGDIAFLEPKPQIDARFAALGAAAGTCGIREARAGNCGANYIAPGDGDVPILTVDSLELPACDALWFDLEGYELPALQGAEATIIRFAPTICVEDKGLEAQNFGRPRGELQAFLAKLGYNEVARFGRDKVFKRTA